MDETVARAYGRVYAAVASAGRKARGRRALDLLIAATALASDLPLYTRNPGDFADLGGLLEIVSVTPTEVYGLGLTTIALPPPRRIGSAAASKRSPPRNSIPVAAPISGFGLNTCPRALNAVASAVARKAGSACVVAADYFFGRRLQGPAPGAPKRQPDPGDSAKRNPQPRPPTEDERGTDDRGELLASQGLNIDPEEQYGTPCG